MNDKPEPLEAAAQHEVIINDDSLGSVRVLLAKGLIAHRQDQGVEIDPQMRQDAIGAAYGVLQAALTAYTQAALDASDYRGLVSRAWLYLGGREGTKDGKLVSDLHDAIETLVAKLDWAAWNNEAATGRANAQEQRAEAAEHNFGLEIDARRKAEADHGTYKAAIKEWREQLQTAEAERDALREALEWIAGAYCQTPKPLQDKARAELEQST